MIRKILCGATIATAALVTGPQWAFAILIDNSDTGDFDNQWTIVGQDRFIQATNPNDTLGGFRKLEHINVSTNVPGQHSRVAVQGGNLIFDNASGLSATLRLIYDGNGPINGLNGLDLPSSGIDGKFPMDFLFADPGSDIPFVVIDTSHVFSTLTQPAPSEPSSLNFLYADFVGGSDFTTVKQVEFFIVTENASDYQIDFIDTRSNHMIPEPIHAGLGLPGLGAMGVATTRRRWHI